MQQRMDLFGTALPEVLKHKYNYSLQIYHIGQILTGRKRGKEHAGKDDSELPVNPEEAKLALGLVEMVYHGIHNLDISDRIQVPHEMLLTLNPSQIFELYAGTWLLKMDDGRWGRAINRNNFWQVVGAARRRINENPLNAYLLSKLDELCGKTYLADEAGNLPARLRQLPPSVATRFMQAFTEQFRAPGSAVSYVPVSELEKGLDAVVFEHFERRFAEGERQFSLSTP